MKIEKQNSRRNFLKNSALVGISSSLIPTLAEAAQSPTKKIEIEIEGHIEGKQYEPLTVIKIKTAEKVKISITDSFGKMYFSSSLYADNHLITLGGALGIQVISAENQKGELIGKKTIKLETQTSFETSSNQLNQLFIDLRWSLVGEWGEMNSIRYNNRIYRLYVSWIRDHTHSLKALKYFNPFVIDGFDFFADNQRVDGMVYDNVYDRKPEPNWWEDVLKKGDFIRVIENRNSELKRQPVEADVEYLFVECLYYSWKACGDSYWMISKLDHCIKALTYCMTDRYRWSEKYKLIKRGFTIDTWDFVHDYDHQKTGYGSGQCIDPDSNEFGIMHGDNTGFVASCNYLSEMLEVANRKTEAEKWKKTGQEFLERLNKIAWNGNFYTHYIPENTDFWQKRDIGKTDVTKQVSLSNSYALNRGIGAEKATKIIESYLNIKNNLPKGSPGEWYTIYPVFENGFGKDNEQWQYMNGGVISIVAGELSKGAFENGFEEYGVDILKRVGDLAQKHNGYLNCTFVGSKSEIPIQKYETISLKSVSNADFSGKESQNTIAWTGEGFDNSLFNMPVGNQKFREIPFEITNPESNNRKGCLILSSTKGYISKAILPINKKSKSIYFLHGRSDNNLLSTITINYKDGTFVIDFIENDKCGNWWYPEETANWKVAFRVKNNKASNIGMGIYGFLNPNPEKEIATIAFEIVKKNESKWFVAGVTLGDQAPYFDKGDVSFGIPDRWGVAACMYGLLEGLAGVQDAGLAFDKVKFMPRWEAASEKEAKITVKYEASGGYFSYVYKRETDKLTINFTGSGSKIDAQILLPKNSKPTNLNLNGKSISFKITTIKSSNYLSFITDFEGVNRIEIGLV